MTSRQCTDLCQIKLRKFAIHNSVPGFVFFFPNFFTVQLAGYCMDQSDLFGIILSLPQAGAIQLLGCNLSRGLQEFQCCFQRKDVTWLSLVFFKCFLLNISSVNNTKAVKGECLN